MIIENLIENYVYTRTRPHASAPSSVIQKCQWANGKRHLQLEVEQLLMASVRELEVRPAAQLREALALVQVQVQA